jgi:hypothetical protein
VLDGEGKSAFESCELAVNRSARLADRQALFDIASDASRGDLNYDPGADLEGQGWHLHQYVEVAAHLQIIKADTATLVRLTKDFRNLIHPGRAARLGQKCDRSTALAALAAVEAVARDLTPP